LYVTSCGPLDKTEYGHEAVLALSVASTLNLQSARLGPGCMLWPALTGYASDSGKYIVLMMSAAALDELRAQLVGTNLPFLLQPMYGVAQLRFVLPAG
jgi:hypothetical protein